MANFLEEQFIAADEEDCGSRRDPGLLEEGLEFRAEGRGVLGRQSGKVVRDGRGAVDGDGAFAHRSRGDI